jgi:hypothetical protein
MGDAEHRVTGDLERRFSPAVALEGGAVTVEFVPVELDHQLVCRPKAVDLEPGDQHADGRPGDRRPVAESEESPLELGAGFGQGSVLGRERA